MLWLRVPDNRRIERQYIIDTVFGAWLGVEFNIAFEPRADVSVSLPDLPGSLILKDLFLSMPDANWLKPESLPSLPLPILNEGAIEGVRLGRPYPALFGELLADGSLAHRIGDQVVCAVDLLGIVFFLLTRYEEIAAPSRDEHGRFPAGDLVATRAGFAQRALADEAVEVLWRIMVSLWPLLRRKATQFEVLLTHDVDWPFGAVGMPASYLVRSALGDIGRRRSPKAAWSRVAAAVARDENRDPLNTFSFLMDTSEQHGLQSHFYFQANSRVAASVGDMNLRGSYALSDSSIRRIIRAVSSRNHAIGLHAGYDSFLSAERIRAEFDLLKMACVEEHAEPVCRSGRHHYLRWRAPSTWRAWAAADMELDSSVGFAEFPGFRCGTSRPFRVFDVTEGVPLSLVELPLIAMDASLTARHYLGLSAVERREQLLGVADEVKRFRGTFVLLWHNSSLVGARAKSEYRELVEDLIA